MLREPPMIEYRRVYSWWHFWCVLTAMALVLVVLRQYSQVERDLALYFSDVTECYLSQVGQPDAQMCIYYPAEENALPRVAHRIATLVPILLLIFCFGWLIRLLLRKAKSAHLLLPLSGIVTFGAGTGIIVNLILKNNWGRPRPYQTSDAGGPFSFVPAGTISDQCSHNCSFVSGDVAAAAWMFFIVPFLPIRYRNPGYAFVGLFTVGMAFARIAMGRHYLSDVILGALISVAVIMLFNLLFGARDPIEVGNQHA